MMFKKGMLILLVLLMSLAAFASPAPDPKMVWEALIVSLQAFEEVNELLQEGDALPSSVTNYRLDAEGDLKELHLNNHDIEQMVMMMSFGMVMIGYEWHQGFSRVSGRLYQDNDTGKMEIDVRLTGGSIQTLKGEWQEIDDDELDHIIITANGRQVRLQESDFGEGLFGF